MLACISACRGQVAVDLGGCLNGRIPADPALSMHDLSARELLLHQRLRKGACMRPQPCWRQA